MTAVIEITADLLLRAYAVGVFPMAEGRDAETVYWIDPEKRGILPLDGIHIPRRLRRTIRQGRFEIRVDHDFDAVIDGCAEPAPDRSDTWINAEVRRLYRDLFRMGRAHTVECYREDALVGGLFGVSLGAAFFGESMFSRERDSSKVALVHLAARLVAGGYTLLDTQFITEHLARFGAIEVPRGQYRTLLDSAVDAHAALPRRLSPEDLETFLQLAS